MERILDAAQFIFTEYQNMAGEPIDEMKLHKLLYLSQRESLAITGKPMIQEDMEGWKYGPVSPVVRTYFTQDGIAAPTKEVSPEAAYIMKNVICEYGHIESWKLSQLTHKETSWLNAREGLRADENGCTLLRIEDIAKDAEKVRPYDHVWDMYYDEFDDLEEGGAAS